jgi:lysophospholipase L1-like esterase
MVPVNRLSLAVATVAVSLIAGNAMALPGPAAAAAGTLRIMPLGDSITAGVGSSTNDGWRSLLQQRLRAADVPFDFVGSQRSGSNGDRDHEGHGGWTIDQLAARADGWLTRYQPQVVLLHAGTNNITMGEDPTLVARKLSAFIDQIRLKAPDAHVFVSKIIDTAPATEVPANRSYNALIPAVVAAKGGRVHLVDQSTVTGQSIYDHHHPNDFGYEKMAYSWYAAMRAHLAPHWPVPADNPYERTSHVRLRLYDFTTMARSDLSYSRVAAVVVNGQRVEVWS